MIYCCYDFPSNTQTNQAIILDIDETLVHSCPDSELLRMLNLSSDAKNLPIRNRLYNFVIEDFMAKRGEGTALSMWGITRPHLPEFLKFCFTQFRVVAVWTAGHEKYARAMCDYIFKDIKDPHVIYSRDHCVYTGPNRTKPIQLMIDAEPCLAKVMSLSNTFAVDDRATTFGANTENGILLPPYQPLSHLHSNEEASPSVVFQNLLKEGTTNVLKETLERLNEDDTTLLELMDWLRRPEVMRSKDVRALDKTNIFSQPVDPSQ